MTMPTRELRPEPWEPAFLAVSLALGVGAEDARAALGARGERHARALIEGLAATSRSARAAALAQVLGQVTVALERMELR